jgi:hypothetical protein
MDFNKLVGGDSAKSGGRTTSLGTVAGGGAAAGARAAVGAAAANGSVTLYGPADEDLLVIRAIEREGNALVVKGQAYGTMPLSASLRPEQARRMFKLLKWSMIPFLVSFLFRRSKRA